MSARFWQRLASLASCAILVWLVVGLSLAQEALRRNDMDAALRYRSDYSPALAARALARLAARDPTGAAADARAALIRDPLSTSAVRALVLATRMTGDERRTLSLLSASAALGWRDQATQFAIAGAAFKAGNEGVAIQRLDALVRTNALDRARQAALFRILDGMLAQPGVRSALVATLVSRVPWRAGYLRHKRDWHSGNLANWVMLLHMLAASPAPPSRAELGPLIWDVTRTSGLSEALTLWRAAGGASSREIGRSIYDGGFSQKAGDDALPFEWAVVQSIGASATIEPAPSGRGSALHAKSDGSAMATLATQALTLPPGRWRFSVDARGSALARLTLRWWMTCGIGGTRLPITRLETSPSESARVGFVTFVPTECATQQLQLRSEGSDTVEPIEIWFDDAALEHD